MLGKNNEFYGVGNSSEDSIRFHVVRPYNQDILDKRMYKECAKKIIFNNCMSACEIDPKTLTNFNREFYYEKVKEQSCLQDCFNTRMKLHFGR